MANYALELDEGLEGLEHLSFDDAIDAETEEIEVPKLKPTKGVCRVCGDTARSPNGYVCDTHDGRRTRHQGSGSTSNTASPKGGGRDRAGGKAPTANDWTHKVFGKVLMLLTVMFATAMVNRRLRIPEGPAKEELIDRLAMTNREATDIAAPFGRMFAGTKISKSHGHHVIDNLDIMDALFSFYEWQQRVSSILNGMPEEFKQRHLATVTNIDTAQAQEGGTNDGTNEQETTGLGFSWDGNTGTGML